MIQLSGSLLSISVPPGIHELVRARSPLDGPEFLRRVCRESEVLVVGANGAQFVVLRVSAIHVPFNSPLVSLVPFPSRVPNTALTLTLAMMLILIWDVSVHEDSDVNVDVQTAIHVEVDMLDFKDHVHVNMWRLLMTLILIVILTLNFTLTLIYLGDDVDDDHLNFDIDVHVDHDVHQVMVEVLGQVFVLTLTLARMFS